MDILRAALQRGLDLVFPPQCAVCRRTGTYLCASCLAAIPPLPPSCCLRCSSQLSPDGFCLRCRYQPLRINGLWAFSIYQEPLRTCIHKLKYAGHTQLAEPLGSLLAQVLKTRSFSADGIIPVPLHEQRQRERGYNQALLLAKVCSEHSGIPVYSDILLRTRPTTAQVQLTGHERLHNVANAFACSPTVATAGLHGRRILIIDDVFTTGATLQACAAPLFMAGANSVWGLVLARHQ